MGIKNFHAIIHDFKPIKQIGNIVLSKCVCCQVSRYGVFIANGNNREFFYHGYSYEEALKTFNFLVKKQSQSYQAK